MAACAAVLALVAAVVAAVGPARAERAEYAWPPSVPATTPEQGWYAPLPLLNRVPESLELRIPCGLVFLPGRDAPATVVATARVPDRTTGLSITRDQRSLRFSVGATSLASVPWPASCPLDVEIADGELRLPDRTLALDTGTLDDMPVVTGLFTSLDLAADAAPEVVVRSRPFDTSHSLRQALAAGLGVLLAGVALFLIVFDRSRRPRLSLRRSIAAAWSARHATDYVVVGTLVAWWIVAPVHYDDGWLWVMNRLFDDVGGVGSYYINWGVNSPLYWLEWLRHWIVGSSSDLLVARLPSLIALVAAWALCRVSLQLVVGPQPATVIRWTLAGAFVVGATSWGMTVRPEPFVVLLAVASLAATVSFVRAPRPAPLALAVIATVLSVTAHPAGLVAAAAPLAAAPDLVRWLRTGGRRFVVALAVLLTVGAALALIVLTLDADLQTRVGDSEALNAGDYHGEPWWREYLRYVRFDENGGATAIRRLGLVLLLLPIVAALTRRRSVQTGILLTPARTVGIGLLLLAVVPSKWAAHFGVLAGVAAVAVAAEVARLLRESSQPGDLPLRLIFALPIFAVAALWAWRAPGVWSLLDLQEVRWNDGFGLGTRGFGWIGLALVAAVGLAIRARRKRGRPGEQSSWVPALTVWSVPVVSFAVVAVTIALLVVDAAIAPWSPTRQNLETLAGRSSCGIAHQLRGEARLAERIADPGNTTLLEPPVALYFPCATIPAIDEGLVEIPTFVVYHSGRWPIQDPTAPFAAVTDLYGFREIAEGPRGVTALSVPQSIPGFARADAVRRPA